jgi:hypothetical protein
MAREWLVIENSWSRSVFADDNSRKVNGYIPRDIAEPLLGRKIEDGRCTWFTRAEGEKMRAHPSWRDTEPPIRLSWWKKLFRLSNPPPQPKG